MKVSVIVPVYNAEKYLKKCINSVVAQTYTDWEVIAIDDGSKDSSYNILKWFAEQDPRIQVEKKQNEGPGVTRNRALDKATGDCVVFLDADDYIEPDYFELLNKKMIAEKADVVFIDVIQETPDGVVLAHEKMSKFKNCSRKDLLGNQMTGHMPWGGVRKAALRTLIDRHNLRYSTDTVGEEAIFSFELLRHAENITFIERELYHYINHPGSQSKSPEGTWVVTLKKMSLHLESEGIKDKYSDCLNAFAFTVLISQLLRYSKRECLRDCLKHFKKERHKFQKKYGWNINPMYLRRELRVLLPFIKYGIIIPVVTASKFVKR